MQSTPTAHHWIPRSLIFYLRHFSGHILGEARNWVSVRWSNCQVEAKLDTHTLALALPPGLLGWLILLLEKRELLRPLRHGGEGQTDVLPLTLSIFLKQFDVWSVGQSWCLKARQHFLSSWGLTHQTPWERSTDCLWLGGIEGIEGLTAAIALRQERA